MRYMHSLSATAAFTVFIGYLSASPAEAHTSSVGYVPGAPGTVTFWYGTYHSGVTATEGTMQVTNGGSYNQTAAFTLLTSTRPTGLIDGTNNFYSDGTTLVGTPTTTIQYWQGATFTGLSNENYTFTYIPAASPSSTWQPTDTTIQSSTVTVSGVTPATPTPSSGLYEPVSSRVSRGAAVVLDSLSASATGELAAALSTLSALSPDAQSAALQRIAPNTNRALSVASTQTVNGGLDTVVARLEGVRTNGYASTWEDEFRNGYVKLASADDASPITGETTPTHGMWGKLFGSNNRQKAVSEYSGYKANTYGLSLGGDTLVSSRWIVGAAFTYAATDIDMTDNHSNDGSDIKTYQLTAYTSRDFGKFYVEGMLTYAQQSFSSSRDTTISGVAQSDYNGSQWGGRLTAGMPLSAGERWSIAPTAGLEWNQLRQDGYDETGAGPLSLNVHAQSATRLRSAIGATASTTMPMSGGMEFKPSVHAVWRHEFKNGGMDTTATFSGGGAAFITPGQNLPKNSLNLGTNLSLQKTKTFLMSLQLDLEKASGYTGKSAQLVGQWRF